MNRFEKAFLDELANLAKTHGFVIVGNEAIIERAEDWVDPSKSVEYTVESREDGGLLIESVDNVK